MYFNYISISCKYVKYIDLLLLNIFIIPPSSIDIIIFIYSIYRASPLIVCICVCVCVEAVWMPWPRRLTLTRRLGVDATDAGDD